MPACQIRIPLPNLKQVAQEQLLKPLKSQNDKNIRLWKSYQGIMYPWIRLDLIQQFSKDSI
jgi:hypothetical protein